ncbi:unnamed protein product [Sphagnum tenellum]
MEEEHGTSTIQVLILGDTGVGKSTLINAFPQHTNGLSESIGAGLMLTETTVTDAEKGEIAKIELVEVDDNVIDNSTKEIVYEGSLFGLLVYDVTDMASFNHIGERYLRPLRKCAPSCFIILVGTKVDLKASRQVDYLTAKGFADANKMKFYETSSMDSSIVTVGLSAEYEHLKSVLDSFKDNTPTLDLHPKPKRNSNFDGNLKLSTVDAEASLSLLNRTSVISEDTPGKSGKRGLRKGSGASQKGISLRPPWRAGAFDDYRRYYKSDMSSSLEDGSIEELSFPSSPLSRAKHAVKEDNLVGKKLQLSAKKVFSNTSDHSGGEHDDLSSINKSTSDPDSPVPVGKDTSKALVPLFNLEIDIGERGTEKIVIYEDDVAVDVAEAFCAFYDLDNSVVATLTDLIESNMKSHGAKSRRSHHKTELR